MDERVVHFLQDLLLVAGGTLVVFALSRVRRLRLLAALAICAICVFAGWFIFAVSDPPDVFWDFMNAYYPAGQLVRADPASLAPQYDLGIHGFVNLPILAYAFAPLASMDMHTAGVVLSAVAAAAVFLAWYLLVRAAQIDGPNRWLLLFLFAANGPMFNSFRLGNTSQLLLLGLVAGLYLLQKKRPGWAGVVLGLVAVVKPPLLLFGLYFLLRRIWGAVLGFAAAVGVLGLSSVLLFGWEMHSRWLRDVLQFGDTPIEAYNNQSILGFLGRLGEDPSVLEDWSSMEVTPAQHNLANLLVGLLVVATIWACVRGSVGRETSRHAPGNDAANLEYLLVVMLALLVSPLTWTHYYVWMLLPFGFLLSRRSTVAPGVVTKSLAWAGVLLVSPVVLALRLSGTTLPTWYSRLLVSHVLIGALIWFGLIVVARSRVEGGQPAWRRWLEWRGRREAASPGLPGSPTDEWVAVGRHAYGREVPVSPHEAAAGTDGDTLTVPRAP